MYLAEKIKRAQKVQATQTDGTRDVCPVTPHKIKSVSHKNSVKKLAQPHESQNTVIGLVTRKNILIFLYLIHMRNQNREQTICRCCRHRVKKYIFHT